MNKKNLVNQLKQKGFSESTVEAFEYIPRENFISPQFIKYAYEDHPLPLGEGATISQPSTIAFMLDLLELNNSGLRLLEIGSGCGYVLGLVNHIIKNGRIFGVEINESIAAESIRRLGDHPNISVFCCDGKNGLKKEAPFDRMLISAACPEIPYYLLEQLNDNGIVVASVQNSIFKIAKRNGKADIREFFGFRFVPLI